MFRFLLAAVLALSTTFANAQFLYKEGKDYIKLEKSIDNAKAPKVIEFFWFGCPHCYSVEPHVKKWLSEKSPEIEFEKVPAIPSDRWGVGAQVFYTAQELNADLVDKIFTAVHEQNNNAIIFNKDRAFKFFKEHANISEEDFNKTWDSFAVKQKMTRARELFTNSGFDGVPAFLANGSFAVPLQEESPDKFFKRLDFIAKNILPTNETKSDEGKTEAAAQ